MNPGAPFHARSFKSPTRAVFRYLSSLPCGLAASLPLLLFLRVVQGVGGGGLQLMAQAILNDTFPQSSAAPPLLSTAPDLKPSAGIPSPND
jgi:MFS family permease